MTNKTVIRIPYAPRYPQGDIHKMMESNRFSVVVAHRRTGKTVCAINHLIKQAVKSKQRSPRFGYIAPYLNQAKMIAWDYLRYYTAVIPGTKLNASEVSVTLPNGATIRIFGADNPDSLRGGYFDCVVLDEVAQMKPEVWHEILRPTLADRNGSAVFIGTPKGQNIFRELYERGLKGDDGWASAIYRADETGVIEENELRSLKAEMSENAFRQEFLCDFNAESDDVLIPIDLVIEAGNRRYVERDISYAPTVIGVDIARFGDDASVFFKRKGLVAYPPIILRKLDNMQVADRLMQYIDQEQPHAVFVDAGGGAGVIDRVRQLGARVIEVPFGGRATQEKYKNRRSEMWIELRDWLVSGGSIPDSLMLRADLSTPTYSFDSSGKMQLEPKDKIKERLGRSPDLADALALTFATPVQPEGVEIKQREDYNPLQHFN